MAASCSLYVLQQKVILTNSLVSALQSIYYSTAITFLRDVNHFLRCFIILGILDFGGTNERLYMVDHVFYLVRVIPVQKFLYIKIYMFKLQANFIASPPLLLLVTQLMPAIQQVTSRSTWHVPMLEHSDLSLNDINVTLNNYYCYFDSYYYYTTSKDTRFSFRYNL